MSGAIVTGSNGQLGLTIKEYASKIKTVNFDFRTSTELDITDKKGVDAIFQNGEYDYCINCAAYTNVEQAEKTPEEAYAINAEGVKNLAIACKAHGTTLVHVSTDYVFDGEKGSPYTVDDTANPINEYGRSKLKGEHYITEILKSYYIIRTSWLYSKKYGHNFYRTILSKALEGHKLYVTDAQMGSPTDTVSLSKFILEEIIDGDKPYGIYHFTDGKAMTWFDFAKNILEENGLTGKVDLVMDKNYRTFARRPKNSVLS